MYYSFQDPPKYTTLGIFGVQICLLSGNPGDARGQRTHSISLGMFSVFWYLFSILIKLTFCCKILWFSGNWYQAISHPLQEFTQDYIGFEFRRGLKVFREIIALVYIELICNVGLI
jgi:hypothetical protein